jgi:tRNA(adenine34) deaminase
MNRSFSFSHQDYETHRYWMAQVIALAIAAGERGEIPVAAIVVDREGKFLAKGQNQKETDQDPTAHAEILALRRAAQTINNWRLEGCTLYVNLEPCGMCAGAIVHSRLQTLVYGLDDRKTGTIRSVINFPDSKCSNHRLQVVTGLAELECKQLLQRWFKAKRNQ